MGESARRRPGNAEPLVLSLLIVQVAGGDHDLAEVVGPERQIPGLDTVLVLALDLHHPPAEEFDIWPGAPARRCGNRR